ncbi:YihY/virulence factor BrkB family protein [Actinocorallia sp. A-T 12471]|uniref:YihY/virulence factor BrkB family protein n=1 Tax=Actinocorallia sp. A-T 12471 TaxID=3089813 RepID=UPI0029D1B4EC|nr:YihY/virulence factor BrkB family protein [Actinocorallia sp. A-T 12471]MDX6739510.1 YihY/virulence factor BrkB family protein [Actinocorallia sp. A-T 12471]
MTSAVPRVVESPAAPPARRAAALGRVLWLLVRGTTVTAFNYRITGLAAEAAFWALLSLPPLVLGLISSVGHLRGLLGAETVNEISGWIIEKSRAFLTEPAVDSVIVPLVDDVVQGEKIAIISVGFVICLWAGSRAMSVYVDTITITYGLDGVRGVIRTRLQAFLLYIVGLFVAVLVIPFMIIGPALVRNTIPASARVLSWCYWPFTVVVLILFLSLLYHLSVPVRTAWWREMPGAVVAMAFWVGGSVLLRIYLSGTVSGVSVSASLTAPIAFMAWLYVTAFAVLVGACLNAEVDKLWPSVSTSRARAAALVKNSGVNH